MAGNDVLEQALSYLDTFQFHGFRLGLERMEAILGAIGNPQETYPCIHVAGTNGKGSTCAVITSILSAAGLKCGFYSSPHLFRLNERFRIGAEEIDDTELASLLNRIRKLIEKGYELSYFEYTTVLAMWWFREREVDVAVFETGLGGRLDATNVIVPEVSVITNIALEHQSYLGDTVEKIAYEKAGIIKRGRPVVCAVPDGPALDVIEKRAAELDAPLYLAGRDFSFEVSDGVMHWTGWGGREITGIRPALAGRHQLSNTALAIAAVAALSPGPLAIDDMQVIRGCASASWPGRGELVEYEGKMVLLDGAHNPAGIKALRMLLTELSDEGLIADVLLWACSDEGGDKDFTAMLYKLSPLFSHVVITEPPGPRKPVNIAAWKDALDGEDRVVLEEDWEMAFERAAGLCGRNRLICVAGSLYLVGSVRTLIPLPS